MRTVSVPFQYRIFYKKYRSSQQTVVFGKAAVDLRLEEVEPEATTLVARIATSMKSIGGAYLEDRFVTPEGSPARRLIEHAGGFWLESVSADEVLDSLSKEQNAKGTPFSDVRRWQGASQYSTLEEVVAANPRCREERDDRDQLQAELLERADRVILVDGMAFERIEEPRLALEFKGDEYRIGLRGFEADETTLSGEMVLVDTYGSRSSSARAKLAWDCLGERLDRMDLLKARLDQAGVAYAIACQVDVVRPGAFGRNVMSEIARDGAVAILKGMLGRTQGLDPELADAILELRDAVHAETDLGTGTIAALERIAAMDGMRIVAVHEREDVRGDIEAAQAQAFKRAKEVLRGIGREMPPTPVIAEIEESKQTIGFIQDRGRPMSRKPAISPSGGLGTHRFELPMEYLAEYTHKGKRNVSRTVLTTKLPVDIPEVDRPGEPAFVLGHGRRRPISRWSLDQPWRRFPLHEDGAPSRVWRFRDGLFSEYCRAEDFVERLASDGDNPLDLWSVAGREVGGTAALRLDKALDRKSYEQLQQEAPLRHWKDDGGAGRALVVSERLEAFRIVDGMVCVKVAEPVIGLTASSNGVVLRVIEAWDLPMDGFTDHGEDSTCIRIRLDSLDFARDLARRVANDLGVRLDDEVVLEKASEVYPYPHEAEMLHAGAERLWAACSEILPEAPRPLVSAALELRDALATCPDGSATVCMISAAHEVVRLLEDLRREEDRIDIPNRAEFRVLAPEIPGLRLMRREGFEMEDARMAVALEAWSIAAQAWEARPRDGTVWCEAALPIPATPEGDVAQVLDLHRLRLHAHRLGIAPDVLLDRHEAGRVILGGRRRGDAPAADEYFVAIVSPGLEVERVIGKDGVDRTSSHAAWFAPFLEENLRRRDAELSMGALAI